MKIFSKEQIYEGDNLTIQRQNISSTELMERAGTQVFEWIHKRMQGAQVPIYVFCGIGNNGGDGLVLARHLITHGYHVKTYIVNCSDKRSKDFLINYDRIKNVSKNWPTLLKCKEDFPEITPDTIIVDCIFGIGMNRAVDDWLAQLFQHFKNAKAFTLAVDIPSGLPIDQVPTNEHAVVWANYTLSFVAPKLVFFLPQTAKFIGQWEVLDIGLDPLFLKETKTEAHLIGKYEVLQMYVPREKYSHKGNFGHVMIIGGSYGKIGAVTLSSKAALSAGAGLVSTFIPKCGYSIMQTAFPEAMVITDTDENLLTNIHYEIKPAVVGFGMGAGLNIKTLNAFENFLKLNAATPLVVDADGINILSKNKKLLKFLPEQTILTPHPKELERLIGAWKDDFEKIKKTKALSKKYNVIIVVKGANSITIGDGKIHVNTTGNPGLATAGSGDVLTGIICGLRAQGYSALEASIFGVYLHGKAADIAIQDYGYQSLIASHVIDYLGKAYLDLFKQPEPVVEEEKTKTK